MPELVIRPKENTTITMTIRISSKLRDQYDKIAKESGRSRNELISMALKYALENMRVEKK